jgi:ATP-binding cassette subfamily F protein 3
MTICRADNISRVYGTEPVFENVSFQIETGERIGLVGPNGAGKTTLLRLLAAQEPPSSGVITRRGDVSVTMLGQFAEFAADRSLYAEVQEAMRHLRDWYAQMVEAGAAMATASDDAERAHWARKYDDCHELLEHHGGFQFEHRIEEVLFGLGFVRQEFDRPLNTFSGGQQSRAMLAKLLLAAPDLMLLDEPTNHLDVDITEWLEQYLTRQSAAMVIVSHDRYFLDRVCNKVFELSSGRLTVYPGNFQAYVRLREERAKVNERVAAKQKAAIAHHQEFIRRNHYGELAKQAKSRAKMIARLEAQEIDRVVTIRGPVMRFGDVARAGDIVVAARGIGKSYDRPLFTNFSFDIERGQRIGIIGPNGSGKTTLLRVLVGDQPPSTGSVKLGHNVRVGYLDQNLETLDGDQTPLDVVRPPWRAGEKAEPFRALLARFGIGADLAESRIRSLSGGERTRVVLARLCAYEVNLLALDEPTNHLDLWASEALERAIREFQGTVIVVSHDRYFLNQTVERLLVLGGERVEIIAGGYERYLEWRTQRLAETRQSNESPPPSRAPARKGAPRKRRFPYRKVSEIEADIRSREAHIEELESLVQQPDVYTDGRRLHEITGQLARLRRELEQLVEHWEEAMELNAS